jgi:hypothetical protein
LNQVFIAAVEAVLEHGQCNHLTKVQAWTSFVADITTFGLDKLTSEIEPRLCFEDRLGLVGENVCNAGLELRPRQLVTYNCQKMSRIDHAIKAKTKKSSVISALRKNR